MNLNMNNRTNHPTMNRNHSSISRNFRHATMLVVEDNADHWDLIRMALERGLPEVQPIWVTNADEAMDYLNDCLPKGIELPKLVLLDLYLPKREDGWQLLQQIKAQPSFRQVPVIVLSYSSSQEDITDSYLHGSTSYVTKPLDVQAWLEYIQTLRTYWWETVTLPSDQYMM